MQVILNSSSENAKVEIKNDQINGYQTNMKRKYKIGVMNINVVSKVIRRRFTLTNRRCITRLCCATHSRSTNVGFTGVSGFQTQRYQK